jgi:hypothetical protein
MCSNRRRPAKLDSLSAVFHHGVEFYRSNVSDDNEDAADRERKVSENQQLGIRFSTLERNDDDTSPFYFGIDCRTEEEMRIGQFPKVRHGSSHFPCRS